MTEIDRNGLEVLDRAECLRLLSHQTLGRIAFTSAALPCVLPVHFHLHDDTILVRTRRGGRLDAALQDAVVAFEVDDLDLVAHAGWSVAVTGVATEVTERRRGRRGERPCLSTGGRRLGRIPSSPSPPRSLTGRRLTAESGPTRR